MAKQLLILQEIAELNSLLRDLFEHYIKLRAVHPLAQKIQFPKIPPILSESMTLHLIRKQVVLKNLPVSEANFSTRGGDLEITLNDGTKCTVEVCFSFFGSYLDHAPY